jgi:hypothetical protein
MISTAMISDGALHARLERLPAHLRAVADTAEAT